MTAFTVVTAVLLFARNHRRAAIWTVGVMTTTTLARHRPQAGDRAQAAGVRRPGHDPQVVQLPLRAREQHRVRRRGRDRAGADAGTTPRAAPGGHRRSRSRSPSSSAPTGSCWACTTCPTWSAAGCWAPRSCCPGWPSTTRRRAPSCTPPRPLPEVVPQRRSAGSRSSSTRSKVEDAGPVPRRCVEAMATESGWSTVVLVRDHGRGPGRRRWPHAAAVAGADLVIVVRRRRHRPRRCARSSPAPASRSGSSRPAPATCWPATSASRSTCAPAIDVALNGQDRAIDLVEVVRRRDGGRDTSW